MSAILNEIIQLMTSGIATFAAGLGGGVSALVSNLFIVTDSTGNHLSDFGGTIFIFASISLVIGLSTRIFSWLTSLGN